jgi:adenylosuccinate lyase
MEARNIFQNLSSIDHYYSIADQEIYQSLVPWLSEEASIAACVKAEIALIFAHLTIRGNMTHSIRAELENYTVNPADVYTGDEKAYHNIHSLVNALKKTIRHDLAPLIHLGAANEDILETGLSWRMAGVSREVILPSLRKLELLLCSIAEREAETPQVGRTNGQHSLPITLGFAISKYVSRLGKSILEIEKKSKELKGKLSGAVGAYNATSMIVRDPQELERIYLEELGLEPSEHSTQLVEPEYLLRLLLEFNVAFGIIANLADDLRNLHRSEINELHDDSNTEQIDAMQPGHSLWRSQHIKSLWNVFMPRINTFFMDQINEHQRDLSNLASQRFIADYITGFCLAISQMIKVMENFNANREKMLSNLRSGSIPGGVMAEPAYILLAECAVNDAQDIIRRITQTAKQENITFAASLAREAWLIERIGGKMTELGLINDTSQVMPFFENPQRYCGLAAFKARTLAEKYKMLMGGNNQYV